MNWKVRFRELTSWRPKNDEERTKNDEERWKIFAKSPTETSQKRYGSALAWIFFTDTIFLTNFKWFSDTKRVEHFCSSLLPLFIREKREVVATQLARASSTRPGELGYFHQKALPFGRSWKAQVGLISICTPCLLNTTPAFFLLILFL